MNNREMVYDPYRNPPLPLAPMFSFLKKYNYDGTNKTCTCYKCDGKGSYFETLPGTVVKPEDLKSSRDQELAEVVCVLCNSTGKIHFSELRAEYFRKYFVYRDEVRDWNRYIAFIVKIRSKLTNHEKQFMGLERYRDFNQIKMQEYR